MCPHYDIGTMATRSAVPRRFPPHSFQDMGPWKKMHLASWGSVQGPLRVRAGWCRLASLRMRKHKANARYISQAQIDLASLLALHVLVGYLNHGLNNVSGKTIDSFLNIFALKAMTDQNSFKTLCLCLPTSQLCSEFFWYSKVSVS